MNTSKWLRTTILALTMLALSGPSAAEYFNENAPIGATVQELLKWADTNNPELAAMSYEVNAANDRIIPAGALPDPMLRVEFMDFSGPGAPDTFNPLPGQGNGTKYTLSQSIPLWGKRDLRKEVATAELEQVKGRRKSNVAEIHASIKSAYALYYQTLGLKKLNQDILGLLDDLEGVTRARYAGGLAPQQDVIRSQVEKTALHSEIINLETEEQQATAKLNALLGRPQGAPISAKPELRRRSTENLNATVLQERLSRTNPQLITQLALIEQADVTRRLVEKNRYPDLTLGIAPTQRGGSIDTWEAMVELNIPLRLDTRRSQEAEAKAMLAAARERQRAIANQIEGDLMQSLAAFDAAHKQEQLIVHTLLPQAELTFRSALTGYETGKVDFATLLDAQRAIWRARQDGLKAHVEQDLRLTEIERMVGEEL